MSSTQVGYILWFNRRALKKFLVVLKIIPSLSVLLALLTALVFVFAAMGVYLFDLNPEHTDDDFNQSKFSTFGEAAWSVFASMMSWSYPNQVIPGYRVNRTYFFFIFAFITLGAYGIKNLILVLVMVEFNRGEQAHADEDTVKSQVLLLRSFQLMDQAGRGWLEPRQMKPLLDELFSKYRDFRVGAAGQSGRVPWTAKRQILLKVLDIDSDGKISCEDFLYLLEVCRLTLREEVTTTFVEVMFPIWANSSSFKTFVYIASNNYFDVAVDFITIALVVFWLANNPDPFFMRINKLNALILPIFLIEMACKLLALGLRVYMQKLRSR